MCSIKKLMVGMIVSSTLVISTSYGLTPASGKALVPDIVRYDNKPISHQCMQNFFGSWTLGTPEPNDKLDLTNCRPGSKTPAFTGTVSDDFEFDVDRFEWEYIGQINGVHIAQSYFHPANAMGKFTGISLFKREGHTLKMLDRIYGGDRHASMIFDIRIEGDHLIYLQGATSADLLDYTLKYEPNFKEQHSAQIAESSFCYGEACFMGQFVYEAHVNKGGEVEEIRLKAFIPAGDHPDNKQVQYTPDKIINFTLDYVSEHG